MHGGGVQYRLDEYCKIQITRKNGKIIIELINFSEENLLNLSDIKFFDSIFDIISEDSKYQITEEDFFKVVEKWFKENKY